MYRFRNLVLAALLLSIGYCLGSSGASLRSLIAQEAEQKLDTGVSEQTGNAIREAHRRLTDARDALVAENKYQTITDGINSFLVLSGGGNARADLESGRGVDPITFAALYAGRAVPEVQALLGRDDQGRITYNNEVVRMYSQSRLEEEFIKQIQIVEVGM